MSGYVTLEMLIMNVRIYVDISLIIYAINLRFNIHIGNITAEGSVSQTFYIVPGSFCMNFRKKTIKKITK